MPSLFLSIFLLFAVSVCAAPSSARMTPTVVATQKAMRWVVNIGTERVYRIKDPYIERLNDFYALYKYKIKHVSQYVALGSGIILDKEGLVLTNWHVVRAADKLVMGLPDGSQCGAHIVGFDIQADLCLLQLEGNFQPQKLHHATFAKADDLLLGETVLTLGNPLGLENSVSQGVLSAVNRNLNLDSASFSDLLQTDAAINPGNSGGPLVNMDGNLIGINQAVRSDAENIGYAIPVKRIEMFLCQWLRPERFGRSSLGFQIVPDKEGIRIGDVAGGSGGKIKKGDRIISVDGVPVTDVLSFGRILWKRRAGTELTLLLAEGGEASIRLSALEGEKLVRQRLGIRVQKLTKSLNEALGIPGEVKGLAISEVLPENEYENENEDWPKRFRRGDLILKVNGKEVVSPAQLSELMMDTRSGASVSLLVARPSSQRYLLAQEEVYLK